MLKKTQIKENARKRRKKHIRKVVNGTPDKPRLVVYRSDRQIYTQLVDDYSGNVLTGISSLNPNLKKELEGTSSKIDAAKIVGKALATLAKDKGIEKVVFDRNGFLYHGRVKAVAEGAREGGLKF